MVVREQDRGAAMSCGIEDDRPQGHADARGVAIVARDVQTSGLGIEVGDPQALLERVLLGKAAGEECASGGFAVELQRRFGTLIPHRRDVAGEPGSGDANRIDFGC